MYCVPWEFPCRLSPACTSWFRTQHPGLFFFFCRIGPQKCLFLLIYWMICVRKHPRPAQSSIKPMCVCPPIFLCQDRLSTPCSLTPIPHICSSLKLLFFSRSGKTCTWRRQKNNQNGRKGPRNPQFDPPFNHHLSVASTSESCSSRIGLLSCQQTQLHPFT